MELKAIFAHCLLGLSMSGLIRYVKEKSWQTLLTLVIGRKKTKKVSGIGFIMRATVRLFLAVARVMSIVVIVPTPLIS